MTVRWGVAGPGAIARQFAEGMNLVDGGHIAAVASRSAERARDFADQFGVPRHYGSYAGLTSDPEIDVVYVATPHAHHASVAVASLEAGKHVLCEKPLALNAAEVTSMV